MSAPIPGIQGIALPPDALARVERASGGIDFGDALAGALEQASASERTATEASEKFAKGDPSIGLHEVMIASEKAAIGLRYAVTLKNKVIEAYRELMSTQL